MAIAVRTATTVWEGDLPSGTGTIQDTSSGVLDNQQVTWASRTEAPQGKTSPEELAAAAHAACYAMALNVKLSEQKITPRRLTVSSTVTFDEVNGAPTVTTSALTVKAQLDGLTNDAFKGVAQAAAEFCPISRLFAGAQVSVEAELES